MESQGHKMTATSAGHEGHGVYLCHRCGWPFPNPHPSSRHRRAHKKVCGKIEGYKVILSEEHSEDHHLAASDDEHASDGDEHTPLPKLVEKKSEELGSSGGVGEKSNKSEDDVYSDAATDFPESGISPRLEERFENVKNLEQKGVGGDLDGSKSVKMDENADRTEIVNDPTESVLPVTDSSAEAVSINGLQPDVIKSETPADINECGKDDILKEEDKSISATVNSEEGRIIDSPLAAVEIKEESCDKLVSDLVEDETLQNLDAASAEAENVPHSAEISTSTKNVGEIALAEETPKNIDATVVLEKVSDTTENTLPEESLLSNIDGTVQIPIDKEVEQNACGNEAEKCIVESKDILSVETVSAPISEENTRAVEDDQPTRVLKKDVDHCEENSESNVYEEAKNEKGEGGSYVEKQVILDSAMPVDLSTDFPSSCDAQNLEELSKPDLTANGSAELNHDKSSPPTSTERQEFVDVENVTEVKDDSEVLELKTTPEQPISKEPTSLLTDTELLSKDSGNDDSCVGNVAEVSAELTHDDNVVILGEKTESPTSSVPEALVAKKSSNETSPDDVSNSNQELACDGNVVASDKSLKESDFQDLHETVATCDDKNIINVEHVAVVDSKSLEVENDDKITKQKDGVSAADLSGSSISRCDSLEANCGSVSAVSSQSNMAVAETNSQSPDTLETNSQKCKTSTEDKSDAFEPPSFMTLVQPGGGNGDPVTAATEIDTMHSNQHHPKSDAQQAGWFPSLTNVVNESEGRKKNEEIIAKVTNWSPVKQHSPLKSLLSEVKSPNTKQVPAADEKDENEKKDNCAPATEIPDNTNKNNANKDMEEWNSPARYPIEIKKEKKKGKSYWVPFVCCSSVHRDL